MDRLTELLGRLETLSQEVGVIKAEIDRVRAGKRRVHVHAILDASQSMEGLEDATLEGINGFIAQQKGDDQTDLVVSLHLFGSPIDYKTLYAAQPISQFRKLTRDDYQATGYSTALNDAVISAIGGYSPEPTTRGATFTTTDTLYVGGAGNFIQWYPQPTTPPRVIDDADAHVVLIITDGRENSSFSRKPQVSALLDRLTKTGRWTFAYIGSDPKTWSDAQHYGLTAGSTYTYANNTTGVHAAYASASAGVTTLRSNVARGVSYSTTNFFDQDAATAAATADTVTATVTAVTP